MDTAIFIKSYSKDFKLLNYCLASIKKYVTGYSEIILMLEQGDNINLNLIESNIPERTIIQWVKPEPNGYIFQQYCKLTAHHYTDANMILFTDSDCLFNSKIDLSISEEKPTILYTDYNHVGDAICWKKCTEDVFDIEIDFEFMRRNGLIYNRETLTGLENYIGDLKSYVLNKDRFSEFNVIGAYAFYYEHDKYNWINTLTESFGQPLVTQLWSHGNPKGNQIERLEYDRTIKTINELLDLNITEL